MLQGMFAKRQQGQLDPWRIVLRALGKVGMAEVWMGPNGGQQVAHQGQMQHLLGSNQRHHALPAFDRFELSRRHAFASMQEDKTASCDVQRQPEERYDEKQGGKNGKVHRLLDIHGHHQNDDGKRDVQRHQHVQHQ